MYNQSLKLYRLVYAWNFFFTLGKKNTYVGYILINLKKPFTYLRVNQGTFYLQLTFCADII